MIKNHQLQHQHYKRIKMLLNKYQTNKIMLSNSNNNKKCQ